MPIQRCVFLIWLMGWSLVATSRGQQMITEFRSLDTQDGLSNRAVFCVVQDHLGFMWFGTRDGLNRYDGYDFRIFRHDDNDTTSLSSDNISCLLVDSQHRLWVGTYSSGLNRYDFDHECFIRYRYKLHDTTSISNDQIRCIFQDRQGDIWVGTLKGLNRWNPDQDSFTRFFDQPGAVLSIASLFQDHAGVFWLGTFAGLKTWDIKTSSLRTYEHRESDPHSLSYNNVWSIVEDSLHQLWIGTGNGLNRLDSSRTRFTRYFHSAKTRAEFPGWMNIWKLFLDSDGTLWGGTIGSGLIRYSTVRNEVTVYHQQNSDPNGLNDNMVWSLFKDTGGMIWVGTNNGLNYFNQNIQSFKLWQHNPVDSNSLVDDFVWAIISDAHRRIYFGTHRGLSIYDQSTQHFETMVHDPHNSNSLIGNSVRSLYIDRDSLIWIGTTQGISRYDPERRRFTHYMNRPDDFTSISHNTIMDIEQDQFGYIWLATFGGLNRLDPISGKADRFIESEEDRNSIKHHCVNSLALDQSGFLWIGTKQGLAKLNIRTLKMERVESTNPDSAVFNNLLINIVMLDQDESLYLGTGNGLYHYNPHNGMIRRYTQEDGLSNSIINGILQDSLGWLWISTNNGLNRFNPSTGKFITYTIDNGLPVWQFTPRGCYLQAGNRIFLGSFRGAMVFYPEEVDAPSCPPTVRITDFKVYGSGQDPKLNDSLLSKSILSLDTIQLFYHQNNLSFQFSALHYQNSSANRYAYMLEGIDQDWNYVSAKQRMVTYGHLPPGNFVFRVKAANSDGVWNPESRNLYLIIRPPFWRTSWFIIISIGSSVIGLIGFYRFRTYIIHQRNQALQTMNDNLNRQIAERQKIEKQLRNAQAYLQNLLDSLSSFIFTVDLNHFITQPNLSAVQFFNLNPDPAIPSLIEQKFPFLVPFGEVIHQTAVSGQRYQIHQHPVKWDGKNLFFDISFNTLGNDKPSGVVVRIDDVTVAVRKEEQFRQAQKMESLGILVGGLAHNFNNLLCGITGSLSLIHYEIAKKSLNQAKIELSLKTIDIASSRAIDLVRDLLRMTRKQSFNYNPVDLNEVIHNVLKICESSMDKSISIQFQPLEKPALTLADQGQLEQAILNLCINASHAMTIMRPGDQPSGGTLALDISPVTADSSFLQEFPDAADSQYWLIRVTDSGVGIDPTIQDKIFDPFFSTKQEDQGTGLGLSTVYYIIQEHKGYITLNSTPGHGTCFKLFLPHIQDVSCLPVYSSGSDDLQFDGNGFCVLVIDDEQVIRSTARDILEAFHFKVIEEAGGEHGIELYRHQEEKIDLVLLDMSMPGLSGFQVFRSLKQIDQNVKVVLTSGYRFDQRIDRMLEEGAVGFLPKPFTVNELIRIIQQGLA